MDTRTKILTLEAACRQRASSPVVVTGYFDVLRAAHIHALEEIRRRTFGGNPAGTLIAFVMPCALELLPQSARAELAAALRVIDYVVTGDESDLGTLKDALCPLAIERLEADDALRYRELVEHVRGKSH
jgi:bifunctional ADP-heptose synthase (sugar kinase/adenylyltransferase)